MDVQHTIAQPGTLTGRGLFTGQPVNVTFRAAPANQGVVFIRGDLDGARIPADIRNVENQPRRTALKSGEASIAMCEHCLSALAALNIDNISIEVDGPEMPGLDGSATPYLEAISACGIEPSDAPRKKHIVTEPAIAQSNGATLVALPSDDPNLQIVFDLDYGDSTIGRQVRTFCFSNGDYAEQIAPARTFALESEARELRASGQAKHLSPQEILVIANDGPMGDNHYRFEDEPVRHKILDLIGDLYLLGMPIQGKVMAYRSSHALNHELVRLLVKQARQQKVEDQAAGGEIPAMDIRSLMRILPHRYPMLLVDRVTEIESDTHIRGIKNVTINEPFFQGHYPGTPIMPGVLIVEAMAQLGGLLIAQSIEHTGKLPILMSMDRVRLRRPVAPGDQIVMEAQKLRIRARIASLKCSAHVGGALAAEAEIKFMLVDDEM